MLYNTWLKCGFCSCLVHCRFTCWSESLLTISMVELPCASSGSPNSCVGPVSRRSVCVCRCWGHNAKLQTNLGSAPHPWKMNESFLDIWSETEWVDICYIHFICCIHVAVYPCFIFFNFRAKATWMVRQTSDNQTRVAMAQGVEWVVLWPVRSQSVCWSVWTEDWTKYIGGVNVREWLAPLHCD